MRTTAWLLSCLLLGSTAIPNHHHVDPAFCVGSRVSTCGVRRLVQRAALSVSGKGMPMRPSEGSDVEGLTGSNRLKKARLRLAEARGIIPAGSSERYQQTAGGITRTTKVRDLTFKVAEPEVPYDPEELEARLWRQPLRWLRRNVELFVPLTGFMARIVLDLQAGVEVQNRRKRAQELLEIISNLGPAVIKAGQALSSRPDLLPNEYLEELQKLQDRLPPYPNELAMQLVEEELGVPFDQVFELVEPNPIAAASIGQVYKARLRSTGELVAVKVQRPRCEEIISVDLYVLRWYAGLVNQVLNFLKRDIDLQAVMEDFGELIFREIDYTAEAANAQRFNELYGGIPDIFVPRVYPELSTRKVLTMEWVEGARLVDKAALRQYGADPSKLVDRLVQCSLKQMLEVGMFHCDPHAGNLLCTPDGKLCYLDFGMMSYVESNQRYWIIEAVIHLVNRDFRALAKLYQRMGFIPTTVDTQPIIVALENALPEVLNASVGELNFKNVINKLGDVMYSFPFSLPPFYIAIIRCLGVLEGVAIQVDPSFRIINDAYPYIASRLLTDPSPELQSALRQLIFKNNKPRWERLEELLEVATTSLDYDVTLAIDQLLDYVLSEQGEEIRRIFAVELVDAADRLGVDTSNFLSRNWRSLTWPLPVLPVATTAPAQGLVGPTFDEELEAQMTPTMLAARRLARTLARSRGFDRERLLLVLRRLLREPRAQDLTLSIASDISERLVSRLVRAIFRIPDEAPPTPAVERT